MDAAGPCERRELIARGITRHQVDAALRGGEWLAAHRGVLLPRAQAADLTARCRAALRTQRDDAAVFGRTAALLLGLPAAPAAWADTAHPIHIAVARDDTTRSRRRGIERHLRKVDPGDLTRVNGVPATSAARTLCDLAGAEPRLLGLAMMDAALRDSHCTADELRASAATFRTLRGARQIRELAGLARGGVDSPGESRARLAIVDAGLPTPDVRLELWDGTVLLARADLGYWRWLIWVEYDGFVVHTDRRTFRTDRHRDRWLARRGWEVMRLSDEDVRRPARFTGHLAAAIAEAPRRIAALPPGQSPEAAAARVTLGIDPAA